MNMDFLNDLAELSDFLGDRIASHVPFLVYVFTFAFLGQVAKRYVWTEKNIRRMVQTADRLWNRGKGWKVPGALLRFFVAIPIPMHPILIAVFFAFFPGVPMSAGVPDTFGWRLVYLLGSALLSLALYDILHAILKKQGLKVRLPGEGSYPPPPAVRTPRDEGPPPPPVGTL